MLSWAMGPYSLLNSWYALQLWDLGAWWTLPIIGNGLGPGARGKEEVGLRRVTI